MSNSHFVVVTATPDHLRGIQRLYRQIDEMHADLVPEHVVRMPGDVRSDDEVMTQIECPATLGTVRVALVEDGVVGMVAARRLSIDRLNFNPLPYCRVENIVVDSAYRQRGIGAALMDDVRKWAKDVGAVALRLNVYSANMDAVRFYAKQGLVPCMFYMDQRL